jgi:hypothetical protein
MSDREFAFLQRLADIEPLTEAQVEFAQCIYNAGWDDSRTEVAS